MKSLIFKRIQQQEALVQYVESYKALTGDTLDIAYLRLCKVYSAQIEGVVHGGFIINKGKHSLRYFEPFDDRQMTILRKKFSILPTNCVEITAIWMTLEARSNNRIRHEIYGASIRYAALSGKRFIIGAAKTKKLVEVYKLVLKQETFQGWVTDKKNQAFEFFVVHESTLNAIANMIALFWNKVVAPKFFHTWKSNFNLTRFF